MSFNEWFLSTRYSRLLTPTSEDARPVGFRATSSLEANGASSGSFRDKASRATTVELKSVSIMFSGSRLILWWLARTLTDADAEHIVNDAAEVPFSCYLFGNLCAINCRRFHEYIFSVTVSYQNHRAEAIKVFITCTLWNRCIKPGKWHKIATILSLFFLVLVSVFVQ